MSETSSATATPVVWVDEVDPATAEALAGAKMGRLSQLRAWGAAVPPGFTVTVEAYRQHCADSGLDALVEDAVAGLTPDSDAVGAASAVIRQAFETTPVADGLRAAVVEAYDELSHRCVEVNVPTAVRSSAVGEDAHDASFAGIFDTYLGVSGPDRVVAALTACWGSLFTARALDYRLRRGLTHHAMPIAVGIIELVHARASGVAFSVHPVTGKSDRIVVEGSWGWGEAVVQGLVTPDHIEIGKADGRVLRYDVARKTVVSAFDYAQGRVVETEMPSRLVDRRVLEEAQVSAVVEAVRRIEESCGYPVDVEWVLPRHWRAGDPVVVVQARPVTVTAPAPAAPAAWNPVSVATRFAFGGKGMS